MNNPTINPGTPPSPHQLAYLKDLVSDLEHLFFCGKPSGKDRDCAAWLAGVLNKHDIGPKEVYFETMAQARETIFDLDAARVRRLIAALNDICGTLEKKLTREQIKTPRHLIKALWSRSQALPGGEETLRAIISDITFGETNSTKHLLRREAIDVCKRIDKKQGLAEVVGFKPKRR